MADFKTSFDMDQDYYAILGVTPEDPMERVKIAYRSLARKFHPDAGPEADPYEFDRAAKAWAVLSDPKKRRYYDRLWKKKKKAKPGPKVTPKTSSPANEPVPSATPDRRTSPGPDIAGRIDDISRLAKKHGPFKEKYLDDLIRIQKRHGIDTKAVRQDILDHWLEGLKGIFGRQANLRDFYLAELTRLESKYGIDASGGRTEVLDTWTHELKKMIVEHISDRRELWPKILRKPRDYGYDVREPQIAAGRGKKKKRQTFQEVLAERLR